MNTPAMSCCTSDCCEPEASQEAANPNLTIENSPDKIRESVRQYYAERAVSGSSCCGGVCSDDFSSIGAAVGYSAADLSSVPEGANLGLGCGNPTAMASIPEGAVVLDLGSGAGFDCFLAAKQVGPGGHVIGIDMTPEMVERARANATSAGLHQVEFRLGFIEDVPVAGSTVDVVISNCVINLSPNKRKVFAEAWRVLKPGGRLLVSDLVLSRELPDFIRASAEAYAGCISGAESKQRYLDLIAEAGFTEIEIQGEHNYLDAVSPDGSLDWLPETLRERAAEVLDGEPVVVSLKVSAVKR